MMRGGQKQRLRTTAQKAKSKAAAEEEARKELFTSDTTPQTIRQRKTQEQAAQNVTESLLELRQMMHSQVKQNEETMHVLVGSSSKITEVKSEMDTIGSGVQVSRRLITKLNRREITDRLLILLAVLLFFGVVLYIIRKRLLGWLI